MVDRVGKGVLMESRIQTLEINVGNQSQLYGLKNLRI